MSKRYINPHQYGERKKPKLNFTISDHNFPLSQNVGAVNDLNQASAWGDENDDEILLMASQACEDAYSGHDISALPDYSLCMQPPSTSTQLPSMPVPTTSKTTFEFKKPTSGSSSLVSKCVIDKCNKISSPLPGITQKVMSKELERVNLTDDLIFNDKIFKGQNAENMYRQMLQLQEENAKLRSENGKLLEKCVTKEGEASILRTQLKSCQVSVDNVRLERIKAQEKVQMEWTEKLNTVTNQMQDLRTQLDFKNLEIISIKERCKMLESSKIKLTQVNVSGHDILSSNKSMGLEPARRLKVTSAHAQTDNKTYFVKLSRVCRIAPTNLKGILPLVLQPTEEQNSLLNYSEKLLKPTDFSQNKCRIFSTFHRIPVTPVVKDRSKPKLTINCIYEDLTLLATKLDSGEVDVEQLFINIAKIVIKTLEEVLHHLETVAQRITTGFQKEMDEKYIEATSTYSVISEEQLLSGRILYKEEQGILARRATAVLARVITCSSDAQLVNKIAGVDLTESGQECIVPLICRICELCDVTSCTVLYSGLVSSITALAGAIWEQTDKSTMHTKLLQLANIIVASRPLPYVSCQTLSLFRKLATFDNVMTSLCCGDTAGNLRTDYEQGVLLYRKDSCYLQVFLKQIEAALKCIERQNFIQEIVTVSEKLIAFYCNINIEISHVEKKSCDCHLVLSQVIVFTLQICARVLKKQHSTLDNTTKARLQSIARTGIYILNEWSLKDLEFNYQSQLGFGEGQLTIFLEACQCMKEDIVLNEVLGSMLTDLLNGLQPSTEELDLPSTLHQQVWVNSFSRFSIED